MLKRKWKWHKLEDRIIRIKVIIEVLKVKNTVNVKKVWSLLKQRMWKDFNRFILKKDYKIIKRI